MQTIKSATSKAIEPHRWTRQQYEQMVDAGALTEDDRVELIDGQIVPISPQNSRHALSAEKGRRALDAVCSESEHVRSQVPIALGDYSEPEPEVSVVPGILDDYLDHHPTEALLVVEVSESSLEKDRGQKRVLYARHQIPEYWILNLIDRHLEVYRDPASSDYKSKTTLVPGDTAAPHFAPDASLSVADLIPA